MSIKIAPETYLYDAINDTNKSRKTTGFDPKDLTAYVVQYAYNDDELFDETESGAKLFYPRGYIRAAVLGLDNNIQWSQCRIFEPLDKELQSVDRGQAVKVELNAKNFGCGVWKGARTDFSSDQAEEFALKMKENGLVGFNNIAVKGTKYLSPISVDGEADPTASTAILTYPIDPEDFQYMGVNPKFQTGDFNEPRGARLHKGIDLRTVHPKTPDDPQNIHVVAAYEGTVVVVSVSDDNPNSNIGMRHTTQEGQVFFTRYLHIKNPMVQVGEYVGQGSRLAQIRYYEYDGVSNPHLHFEVTLGQASINGKRLNPKLNNVAVLEY